MTTLLGLNAYQSEALIACLAASVVWAGVLLAGAMHLERSGTARGDRLWIAALLLAILPSLVAPSLAAFGVSLRPPPASPMLVEAQTATPASAVVLDRVDAAARTESGAEIANIAGASPLLSFDQAMNALALLYIYGAALAFFIWAARQAGFLIAAGLAEPVRNEKLLASAEDWAFEFGVKAPALKRSRHVSSVCVYGAVSPVVLIPHDLDSRVSEDDVALMCAHEIAHLKRGDTRLFTATALARVLFWFNPLVTSIAARVELAAEEGADRLVIGSGVDRRAYASCFVKGLKYAAMKQNILPALAPGFTPNDRQGRRRRLDSILSTDGERRASFGARAALAGAASVAALIAVGQAAFAVDPEAAAEKRRLALAAVSEKDIQVTRETVVDPVFKKPVEGDVTLPFGKTFKSLDDNTTPVEHQGVDIKAAKGTPVKASADGIVVEASSRVPGKEGYGTLVIVDHGHGMQSRYAHLDGYKVKIGQSVKKGEVIGAVGETGKVTGPHLHFEVLKNGRAVEPAFAALPDVPDAPLPPQWVDAEPVVAPVAPIAPVAPEDLDLTIELSDIDPDPAIQFVINGAEGFAFRNGDTLTDRMAADLEQRLLGDIEIADGAVYDIEFTIDGETRRFTSGDPMTPEKRAEMKAAIAEMRIHREKAREEMARSQKEWRKHAEKIRASAEKRAEAMKRDFSRSFVNDRRFAQQWDKDAEAARHELEEARREAMEAQQEAMREAHEAEREARQAAYEAERDSLVAELEALSEARADLGDALNDGLDDALAEIDAEEAALDDEDASEAERRTIRLALAEARREIESSRREHEREIERAKWELERREAEIERDIGRLDDRMKEAN